MAIEVHCAQCDVRIRVDDRYAGRRGKCKDCGSVITVPTTAPEPAAPAPAPAALARPQARPAARRAPAYASLAELAEMERTAVCDHVPPVIVQELTPEERNHKPRLAGAPRSSAAAASNNSLLSPGMIGLAGFALLLFLLGLFVPTQREILGRIIAIAGISIAVVGKVWTSRIPYSESTACGRLFAWIPGYEFYYFLTRFNVMLKPVVVNCVGIFIFAFGLYIAHSASLESPPGRGSDRRAVASTPKEDADEQTPEEVQEKIVGRWRETGVIPGEGTITTDMEFRSDGSCQAVVTLHGTSTASGRWRLDGRTLMVEMPDDDNPTPTWKNLGRVVFVDGTTLTLSKGGERGTLQRL